MSGFAQANETYEDAGAAFDRPIIVLGAPRSGTTILHHCLALHPELWHLPGESHAVFEGPFHPAARGYDSNRLTAADLTEPLARSLRRGFLDGALNLNRAVDDPAPYLQGNRLSERIRNAVATRWHGRSSRRSMPARVRFLEKTPKNMLRVPLLDRLLPDARFVLLTRRAETNIDSLIAGWHAADKVGPFRRERFARAGYKIARSLELSDYRGAWWKFALPPDWRSLHGGTVADVAAFQWWQCNRIAADDLSAIPADRVFAVSYEEFVAGPVDWTKSLLDWAGLDFAPIVRRFAEELPRVNDATPQARRGSDGLRHGAAVRSALERRPEIAATSGPQIRAVAPCHSTTP